MTPPQPPIFIFNKVLYLKMKGDYNRNLAEFLRDNDYNDALENALNTFKDADKLAKMNLTPINPIRLGLNLNTKVASTTKID